MKDINKLKGRKTQSGIEYRAVAIPKELYKKVRLQAAKDDMPIVGVVSRAIKEYLKRKEKEENHADE